VPITDVLSRVSELEALAASTRGEALVATPDSGDAFARALAKAAAPATTVPASTDASGSVAAKIISAAESQVGQAEQPPGSNDGPQIAVYRSAVAGAQPGEPWCAYFTSWAAAQAGAPLGDAGAGIGSVAEITSWAQRTGRYVPAGSQPQPGDLILFGTEHVGLVESVNADGSLTTIEGNSSDAVSRVHRMPGEATGFVRLGG
jgi:cell wall-associated NlpC family hydrolase